MNGLNQIFNIQSMLLALALMLLSPFMAGAIPWSLPLSFDLFDEHGTIMLLIEVETGRIYYANKAASAFYGRSIDELLKMHIQSINTLSEEEVMAEMSLAAKENRNYFLFEHLLASGETRNVEVYSYPFLYQDTNLLYSIIHDITPRIVAEEVIRRKNRFYYISLGIGILLLLLIITTLIKVIRNRNKILLSLERSEKRYKTMVENTSDALFIHNELGAIKDLNQEACHLLGYSREELLEKNLFSLWNLDQSALAAQKAKLSEEGSALFESVIERRDGSSLPIEVSSKVFSREEGEGVHSVMRDMTEHVRKKRELKEREMLESAAFAGNVALWRYDVKRDQIHWSSNIDSMLGFDLGESPKTWEAWKNLIHLEDRLKAEEAFAHLVEDGLPFDQEYRIMKKEGPYIWWRNVGKKEKGPREALTGACFDITDQKQTEEMLRYNQARLRNITHSARDAIIMMDEKGLISYWNPAAQTIFQRQKEEAVGKNLHQLLAPKRYHQAFYRAFPLFASTGQGKAIDKTLELVGLRKDGEEIEIKLSLSSLQMKGAWHAVGIIRDITKRKESQHLLEKMAQEKEDLYDQLVQEIDKARFIHEETLPKELPSVEGISTAAYYKPAQRMGGDFYNLIHKDNLLILYLSDVAGHGLDGAMLSVFIKNTIDSFLSLSQEVTASSIFAFLKERFLKESYPEEYFICIYLAVLDLDTKELRYLGAGFQDYPLVYFHQRDEYLELDNSGLPISSLIADKDPLLEKTLLLEEGATLFFNTDGLTEQMVGADAYFYRLKEDFRAVAHLSPELIVYGINEKYRAFNKGSLQGDDDITFFVLQVDPKGLIKHEFEINSSFDELEELYLEIRDKLPENIEKDLLLLCIHELTANAIEHGNKFHKEKKIALTLQLTEKYLLITIEDEGGGFLWEKKLAKEIELIGKQNRGRGLLLTQFLSHSLFFNEKGNRAYLFFSLKEDSPLLSLSSIPREE